MHLTLNFHLDLVVTLVKHALSTTNHDFFTCVSIQNVTNPPRVIERTRNTAIQFLTLNYDLDLEPTMGKHMYRTSTYHS